jgi:hypothetical protein
MARRGGEVSKEIGRTEVKVNPEVDELWEGKGEGNGQAEGTEHQ